MPSSIWHLSESDLYGQSIMQITHPEDQNMLKQQLIPTELENLFDAHGDSDAEGEPRQRSKAEEDAIDRKLREDRRSFRVRLVQNLIIAYLITHLINLILICCDCLIPMFFFYADWLVLVPDRNPPPTKWSRSMAAFGVVTKRHAAYAPIISAPICS